MCPSAERKLTLLRWPLTRQGLALIVRSLGVLMLSPIFFVYMLMSFINQLVRRALQCTHCTKKFETEDEKALWLTAAVSRQIDLIKQWALTGVITTALNAGVVIFCLIIGSKVTTVFFGTLNGWLTQVNLGWTTMVYVVVGFFFFFLYVTRCVLTVE